MASVVGVPSGDLSDNGIFTDAKVHWNLDNISLIDLAVERGEGFLTADDALVTETGERTGRSPNDKFIVDESSTNQDVHWGNVNISTDKEVFDRLKSQVIDYLSKRDSLFVQDLYCGTEESEALSIRVINQNAWHNAFARNMFVRPTSEQLKSHTPQFVVYHAPHFEAEDDALNSQCFVIVNYAAGEVIIGGTRYAGEIKKSIFSVMNLILPKKGILPMHCSANTNGENTAIFFGLSGTGKTTLSADPKRALIGDDEHGWGANGVFNFEGGCYAKTLGLTEQTEPEILATTTKFSTVIENMVYDEQTKELDFFDSKLTVNMRAAYPMRYISKSADDGLGMHPKHLIMLTCDAFGVLPPVARLSPEQTIYHFLSGFTSKAVGTERGVKVPEPTFSSCFGAPFLPLKPEIYGSILKQKIIANGTSCWLINTGWTGGSYGIGTRMPIKATRAILDALLTGKLDDAEFRKDDNFKFLVPVFIDGVERSLLNPRENWENSLEYDQAAEKLVKLFEENFKKHLSPSEKTNPELLTV